MAGTASRKVILVSNTVMHYRVSVYNYFWRRFQEEGWEFKVATNQIQPQNRISARFHLETIPFHFRRYREMIRRERPDAIILFLHLKDRLIWPLIHWLRLVGIPFAFWTKTRNLDDPDNVLRNAFFNYVHHLSNSLILYSADLQKYVPAGARNKVFVANNTVNFEDYPQLPESREEIKAALGIPFRKVVLFAGRMDVDGGRKRVDHLIEIFRELDGRDAGLVIVGSGLKPEWKERMNPQTTRYLGEVHDPANLQISRIFKMADVCAIPGHVGLGINQAFFWGLPVVTEAGRQPPEVGYLQPGRNGFIVPQGDLGQLREKIFYLLDNDAVRQEFSRHASEDIRTHGSIEGMFQGFLRSVTFMTPQPGGRTLASC